MAAWDQGCKGCTTYRPNDVTGSVLSVSEASDAAPGEAPDQVRGSAAQDGEVVYLSEPLDRPSELEGQTYKLKWPDSEHALYITINDIVIAGHRRPFEVFINSKNMEHFAWTVALTRMISAVFRRGGDVSFVVEELKAVFDPRGGAWMNGRLCALDPGGHRRGDRTTPDRHRLHRRRGAWPEIRPQGAGGGGGRGAPRGPACPSCGNFGMHMVEGCMTCPNCGYSKCG